MRDQASLPTAEQLISLSNETLGRVDPVVMNLVVAKGIPTLANLDVGHYVRLADEWAHDLRTRMPAMEEDFRNDPHRWLNDIDFFRLGLVCWYVDTVLGIAYREDHRSITSILYTNPADLFLNGVMDTRRGTCGNLATLHVVIGRRIGLPVSLACAGPHLLCRFDDGSKTINIEATETGHGGFSSPPDEDALTKYKVPRKAQTCGSDLPQAVTPREMLGLFIGFRARHLDNMERMAEAEPDYLLARYLFPRNRQLYISQNQISVQCSMKLFEPGEKGHPIELAHWLQRVVQIAPWTSEAAQRPIHNAQHPKDTTNGSHIDAIFEQIFVGGDLL